MGLHTPPFNNLNEIKNRTPLLSYIVRPLVYETSFQENLLFKEYIPQDAYIQAYGFIPSGPTKLDWAVYVGNSPNMSSDSDPTLSNTGLDTSRTLLIGGRVGIRHNELKAGFSATRDYTDQLYFLKSSYIHSDTGMTHIGRTRLGADSCRSHSGIPM